MIINRFANNVKIDINYELNTLEEGLNLFNLCNRLIGEIEVYLTNEEEYDLDNGIILLDSLDALTSIRLSTLESFHINAVSGYQDIRRRLFDAFEALYPLKAIVASSLEVFVPLDEDELTDVYELLKIVSGHIGIFIFRQFEFMKYKNGEEPEFSLKMYLENHKISFEGFLDLYKGLLNKVKIYRPRIDTFDEHPELEDLFMEKVGPWFYDIKYIDYKDVLDVINDKLDPEDLKVKLNGEDNGDL